MSLLGLNEKPQTMKKAQQPSDKFASVVNTMRYLQFAQRITKERREMIKQRRRAILDMEIESAPKALAPKVEGRVVNLSM